CCRRPDTDAAARRRSSSWSKRTTASSCSICARATSRSTSAPAPWTSASPVRTCCWTPAPRPTRSCRWASRARPSASRHRPGPAATSPSSRAPASPPATRTSSRTISSSAASALARARLATTYEDLVAPYLLQRGIAAEVVHLDGAVESSIRLGVADVIADVVETGTTLRQAGLEPFGESIMTSQAVLFSRHGLELEEEPAHPLEVLERRTWG